MRILSGIKQRRYFLALLALWLLHLLNNYIWLRCDKNYLTYDSHRYFLSSLKIFDSYRGLPGFFPGDLLQAFTYQPPLVGILTAPFYFFFGASQDAGVMLNAGIFLALLIFSVYKLGKAALDERCGLLAAFLVTVYPAVFNQLKVYMLDLPLTALAALSIYLLILSRGFSSFKYSLLFGVSCAGGMLIKQYFVLFIIAPLFFVLLRETCGYRGAELRRRMNNLALSLSTALLLILPYYLKNIPLILYKADTRWVTTWSTPVPESWAGLDVLRSLLWYIWGFINWQASFVYFLFFLAGFFFYLRRASAHKGVILAWLVSSWLLVGWFQCAIGFNMEVTGVRYTMPLLPAAALITAAGIIQISAGRIRMLCVAAAAVFGVVQLFYVSYPLPGNSFLRDISLPIHRLTEAEKYKILPHSLVLLDLGPRSVSGSDSGSYPIDARGYFSANEEVLRIIAASREKMRDAVVFIIPDNTRLWYLQYKAYNAKEPLRIICDWNSLGVNINLKKLKDDTVIEGMIRDADYLIDKSGGSFGEWYVQPFVNKAQRYFAAHRQEFTLAGSVPWPDGSRILVFKRKQKDA